MKVNTNILMDILAPFEPKIHNEKCLNKYFEKVEILTEASDVDDATILFCVDRIGLSSPEMITAKHIISIGTLEGLIDTKTTDLFIELSDEFPLLSVFKAVNEYFFQFERWKQLVMMRILKKDNIRSLLNVASQLLKNPIALFDNQLALIAKAGTFEGSIEGTIWEGVIRDNYASFDFYSPDEQQEISKKTFDENKPMIYHTTMDIDHTYVTSQLKIDNKAFGALGLVDINCEITEGQLDIIQYINNFLKLYFRNNEEARLIFDNETTFLTKLLDGVQVSHDLMKLHFKNMNWKETDPFQLFAIRANVAFDIPIRAIPYIKHIKNVFKNALVVHYKETIVVLCRVNDYDVKSEKFKKSFEGMLNQFSLYAGLSSPFTGISHLDAYFVQCAFASQLLVDVDNGVILQYDNCVREHIIKVLTDVHDLRSYCHPEIYELWAKNDDSMRELIRCMHLYLHNGRNLNYTAQMLFIHRNTLLYRINKIAKLLSLDFNHLTDEEIRYILLSCMFVENL